MVRSVPAVNSTIHAGLDKAVSAIKASFAIPLAADLAQFTTLPEAALSVSEIRALLDEYRALDDASYTTGRVSGAVYSMSRPVHDVAVQAFDRFSHTNPLHPDLFHSVRMMEAQVVAMVLGLFHGDAQACGTMTSGGTESILLACKTYRDRARAERRITRPEMVAGTTVHAAFMKAAEYFGIKLVLVDIDPVSGRVDLAKMRHAVGANTVLVVGSAPCFSLGIIDDIGAIAEMARGHGIGCHVDCCLGGFVVPFAERLPVVDFRLPGVTSISCDPHKVPRRCVYQAAVRVHAKGRVGDHVPQQGTAEPPVLCGHRVVGRHLRLADAGGIAVGRRDCSHLGCNACGWPCGLPAADRGYS